MTTAKVRPVAAVLSEAIDGLGEGPVWSAAEQALYWIDVIGRRMHRRRLGDGADDHWDLLGMPGSLAFRRAGGLLLTSRNGIALADTFGGTLTPIGQSAIDFSRERINDGAADSAGRFWFGTFAPNFQAGGGGLYRMDTDFTIRRMDWGITLSNGIAWSPDDRTIYYTDSRPGCIYASSFDAVSGEIGERRVFIDYGSARGRPDGCATDEAGYLWVAEIDGGRVARYSPAGTLERAIDLPVSRPTSVAFGGPQLTTLFVTSMSYSLSAAERQREPLAGSVFALEVGIRGHPRAPFGG